MFRGLEVYWLYSSPSSFNEDLRRKNGWQRIKEVFKEKRREKTGDMGKEEKVT